MPRSLWSRYRVHLSSGSLGIVLACVSFVVALFAGAAPARAQQDLTQVSLEQLLNVEVYSASKFGQRVSDAPAAVTVITAEDIKVQGARTLGDILRLVPGMFVFSDRQYQFVGIRGFGRPGDYNSRMLLTIDGYRVNDPIYDGASVGTEGNLDVDLIDRVEIIRGPGSSVYGSNALLAVVNIVTRRLSGNVVEVSGEAGSGRFGKARATLNREFDNGANVMFSFTGFGSRGKDLYFSEFDAPATNNGVAQGQDFDRGRQVFGRFSYEGLTLTTVLSNRSHGFPAAPWGMAFNDSNNSLFDGYTFYNLEYRRHVGEATNLNLRLYGGAYEYEGTAVIDRPPFVVNRDSANGKWWGAEAKGVTQFSARHKLVAGAEYQDNYRQLQQNLDLFPPVTYFQDVRKIRRYGAFVQDEFSWREDLLLTLGLRYDGSDVHQSMLSPRLAAVYKSSPATVWKLLYGHAFRAPNVFEQFYAFPDNQVPNSALKPERVRTFEAVWEHYLSPDSRMSAQAYRYEANQLIDLGVDAASGLSQYQNLGKVRASGFEGTYEQLFRNRARLRTGLAMQQAHDDAGAALTNSPRWVANVDASMPLMLPGLRLGLNGQYLASRQTPLGTNVGGYPVGNLTLLYGDKKRGVEVSASVYNLFDRRYHDPVGFDPDVPTRASIQQDGRSFRLKLLVRL